jgi:hypothetical protein
MRTLLLSLMIAYGATSAFSQNVSQENRPLSTDEGRKILGQLFELESCRNETEEQRIFIDRDKQLDDRERASSRKEVELSQKELSLKDEELRIEKEKSETYRLLLEQATKKKGIGCFFKKFFTAGIARC